MAEAAEVTIQQGKLRGSTATDIFGSTYFSFQGIPYAKPPIGDLRFKAPVAPDQWSGIFDATKEGSSSISRNIHKNFAICGGENCLVLNVYTKQLSQKVPVLFWIHGGGFVCGSSTTEEYGPDFLVTEDVVVVSINYRLGLLGFLSLKDESLGVPGNAAFKDMVLALKWVQNNISNFGGDPNNVTIFGQSAGGAAVQLLTLSPMAAGLFHKAIAQSGSVLNPWAYGHKCADEIAKAIGLENIDEKTLLDHLRQKSTEEIFQIQEKVKDKPGVNNVRPFGFVIESNSNEPAFLAEDPIKIIASGKFNQVPFITGSTTKEGLFYDYFNSLMPSDASHSFEDDIPWFFGYKSGTAEIKSVADKIKKFYYGEEEPSTSNADKLHDIVTDVSFLNGIYVTVIAHAAIVKTPVYFYQMSFESELNFFKKLIGTKAPGVSHCDDLGYLFKTFATPKIKAGSLEEKGLRLFVKLWTNFAKFGNPTPETDSIVTVIWKPAKPDVVNYLDIGETLQMRVNPEPERITFWKRLFAESPAGQRTEYAFLK